MRNGGKSVAVSNQQVGSSVFSTVFSDEVRLLKLYRMTTFVFGSLLLAVALFLTYVAIVTFDRSIDQKFLQEAIRHE
jgi:hypothetical protein